MNKLIPIITITIAFALSACQSKPTPMPIPPNVSFDRCNFLPFAGERLFSFDGKSQMSIDIRQKGRHTTIKDGQTVLAQGGYDLDKGIAVKQGSQLNFYRLVFEDDNGKRHPDGLLVKLQADGQTVATGCDPARPHAPCRTAVYGGNAVKGCEEWRLDE